MTFVEWSIKHYEDRKAILEKLKDKSEEEIVEYFNYDNMVDSEPNYCPLYAMGNKCHNMKDLNCLLCACPFFKFSDDKPIDIRGDIKVMSVCTIDSKHANSYIIGNKQQCDCSQCTVPHKYHVVMKFLKELHR